MGGKSDSDNDWEHAGDAIEEPTTRTDLSEMLALAESMLHKSKKGQAGGETEGRHYNRTSSGVRPILLPNSDHTKTAPMPAMRMPGSPPPEPTATADADHRRETNAPPSRASRPARRRRGARLFLLLVMTSALGVLGSAVLRPGWFDGPARRVLHAADVARSTIVRLVD
jgi:hypothetical protein